MPTHSNATNYEPKIITDEDVRNEKRISIGDRFDELENTVPQITRCGRGKVNKIETIEDAEFHPAITANLAFLGIGKLTYVQKYVIPFIRNGNDLIVSSPTGSGKTAAYLLPILSNLLHEAGEALTISLPFALIVAPTHELAIQILFDAKRFVLNAHRKVQVVYGGTDSKSQIENLKNGCEILIGTPGRLVSIIEYHDLDLTDCRYVVLDEVDRLMESDFPQSVHTIMEHFYDTTKYDTNQRQTLMFSATFPPKSLQRMFRTFLFDSNYDSVVFETMSGACKHIKQIVEPVEKAAQFDRLVELIERDIDSFAVSQQDGLYQEKTLVFVNRKNDINELPLKLEGAGITLDEFRIYHGDLDQAVREMTLNSFRIGDFPVLIASSVASRGLDIPGIVHVINYNLPIDISTVDPIAEYVQRIGRTGRVGNRGKSTCFLDLNDEEDLEFAENLVNILMIAEQDVPDFLLPIAAKIRTYSKTKSIYRGKDSRYFMDHQDWDR